MHVHDATIAALTDQIVAYAVERVRATDLPLDGPATAEALEAAAGQTITAPGIGGEAALALFRDVLAPATISSDHPGFLSFVPAAPTEASVLFDLIVGASSIYGGSWMEGAGAVFAENQALRWIADLVGLPADAGGVFVSGGTAGNLSALIAARHAWRARNRRLARVRGIIVSSTGSHSSIASAARAMDADLVTVPADERGRMSADSLAVVLERLDPDDRERIFAIVTTNAGVIDDLDGVGAIAAERDIWLHVDGAYGGAALCSPAVRPRFAGIEQCDSFIVDPHKWLFAPFDCCALVYRHPEIAREAHTQHAEYLDVLTGEWNPSDYAHHLTRRVRGLPFWFSLATHGTDAYARAIDTTLAVAGEVADMVRTMDHVELVVEPELSVVLFRRHGWQPADYHAWSDRLLAAGTGLVVPTSWAGETVLRFCFVNPLTTPALVSEILESMR
ncbi:MAG TPA: aminotransferase class V-fold PLP-dependent enzyme [Ilumatobacteraceae bacterium]|nr:aminotransferase class V-fold PLP-dependent enzyme [Ilumatobacteraceae bacterium]